MNITKKIVLVCSLLMIQSSLQPSSLAPAAGSSLSSYAAPYASRVLPKFQGYLPQQAGADTPSLPQATMNPQTLKSATAQNVKQPWTNQKIYSNPIMSDTRRTGAFGRTNARLMSATTPRLMTQMEAADVLGVAPNALDAEIKRAFTERMLKAHPDQGGSSAQAQKIIEARNILKSVASSTEDFNQGSRKNYSDNYSKAYSNDSSKKSSNNSSQWYSNQWSSNNSSNNSSDDYSNYQIAGAGIAAAVGSAGAGVYFKSKARKKTKPSMVETQLEPDDMKVAEPVTEFNVNDMTINDMNVKPEEAPLNVEVGLLPDDLNGVEPIIQNNFNVEERPSMLDVQLPSNDMNALEPALQDTIGAHKGAPLKSSNYYAPDLSLWQNNNPNQFQYSNDPISVSVIDGNLGTLNSLIHNGAMVNNYHLTLALAAYEDTFNAQMLDLILSQPTVQPTTQHKSWAQLLLKKYPNSGISQVFAEHQDKIGSNPYSYHRAWTGGMNSMFR
jgi:hypothetical protein